MGDLAGVATTGATVGIATDVAVVAGGDAAVEDVPVLVGELAPGDASRSWPRVVEHAAARATSAAQITAPTTDDAVARRTRGSGSGIPAMMPARCGLQSAMASSMVLG